jgi:hypothetical protein
MRPLYKTAFYFDLDQPSRRQYKELIYVGQLAPNIRKRVIPNGPSEYVSPSILKNIFPDEWEELHKYADKKYFYNMPSKRSIDIAEMRIDELRPWPIPDRISAYGMAIADEMLEMPLTAMSLTDEETRQHLDLKKGPSIPWKWLGYKTRQDVFNSEVWISNYENIEFLDMLLPIYESVGKEELAAIEDLFNEKVRTFQTTSAHLLYWQIRLFGKGTENMKNYKWSKYGFNPFYGGTDRWYREINVVDENGKLLYTIRLNWDINGYDRKILLHRTADRRFQNWCKANPNSPHKKIAKWVTNALKERFLLMHNGDLVIRLRGNDSGSGMTTVNNIEAGFDLMGDLLTFVYNDKHEYLPPKELVLEQLISLFGDDNSMTLHESFSGILDEGRVKDRLLNQHGLVCKWLIGGVERPWADLPFLGFVFSEYKNFFIPKWVLARLIHPILYTPTRKTTGQYLQQFYSLLVMSFAHGEVFHYLRDLYLRVLQYFMSNGQADVKMMLGLGVPSVEYVEAFYLGLESDSKLPLKWTGECGGPLVIDVTMMSHENEECKNPVSKAGKAPNNLEWCDKTDCVYSTFYHVQGFCDDLVRCSRGHVRLSNLTQCMECVYQCSEYTNNPGGTWHLDDPPDIQCDTVLDGTEYSQDLIKTRSFNEFGNKQVSSFELAPEIASDIREAVQKAKESPCVSAYGRSICTSDICFLFKIPHCNYQCEGIVRCPWGHAKVCYDSICATCSAQHWLNHCSLYVSKQTSRRDFVPPKCGSFDPYGNEQTSDSKYVNIFRPSYNTLPDGTISVVATVQYDNTGPQIISGVGADMTSAFSEWELQIDTKIEIWDPLECDFIKHLQTLPTPEGPIKDFWTKNAHYLFKKVVRESGVHYSRRETKYEDGEISSDVETFVTKKFRTAPDITNAVRYVQISAPTIQQFDDMMYYANYIVAIDGSSPQMYTCSFSGVDIEGAFINWLSEITGMFGVWAPPSSLQKLLIDIRKLPPPETNHPLSFIWSSDIDHTLSMILEGSFNPYGNGQPKMTKPQYLAKNKSSFDRQKLTAAQRVAKYNSYAKAPNRKPLTAIKQDGHKRIAPTKEEDYKNYKAQIHNPATVKQTRNLETGITRMSPCSRIYFAALMCPFFTLDDTCASYLKSLRISMSKGDNPCIPTIPNVKSRKFSAFARGELAVCTVGTVGQALIAFAPRRLANDGTTVAYNVCPIYQSSTSTPIGVGCPYPNLDVTTGVDTGIFGVNLNADYLTAAMPLVNGKGIKFRVVAAGLRIRYIGTELNRGGIIHATVTPNHDTLTGGTVNSLGQLETYFKYPVTRDWVVLTHTPVMDDDFLYFPDLLNNPSFFGTIFTSQSFQHYLGFQITDCVGGSFEWEAICHYEVVGAPVRGLTPTPADLTGMSAVLNVATPSMGIEVNKLTSQGKDVGSLLGDGIKMVSGLGKELLPFAKMMMG